LKPKDILPGVTKFIEQLKIRKIKIALGSASKNAMTILSNLEFTEPFEAIIDGTKVSKAKPNPEIFLEGAKAVGAKPEECIVFEDAQAGIDAAKNAGMFVIGIGNEENLKGANFIIEGFLNYTFDELLQKL
ncbi:MAG: HAD-IA family hydrolase, partial [Bacteroidota bacterium]|nr:HAD-IA family hydrolase [Bacteroidota bacterium]